MENAKAVAIRLSTDKNSGFPQQGLAMRSCYDKKSEEIYVFGGHIGEEKGRGEMSLDFKKFNIKTKKWISLAKPPEGRLYPAVFFSESKQKIFCWGGRKTQNYTVFGKDFVIYDVEKNSWKIVKLDEFEMQGNPSILDYIDSPHVVMDLMRFPLHDNRELLMIFGWTGRGTVSLLYLFDFNDMLFFIHKAPEVKSLDDTTLYSSNCFGCVVEHHYYNIIHFTKPYLYRLDLWEMKEWELVESQNDVPWAPSNLSHLQSWRNHRFFLWGGTTLKNRNRREKKMEKDENANELVLVTLDIRKPFRKWSKLLVVRDEKHENENFHIKRNGDAVNLSNEKIFVFCGVIEMVEQLARDIYEIDLSSVFVEDVMGEKDDRNRIRFLMDDEVESENHAEIKKIKIGLGSFRELNVVRLWLCFDL